MTGVAAAVTPHTDSRLRPAKLPRAATSSKSVWQGGALRVSLHRHWQGPARKLAQLLPGLDLGYE